jgi:hypothetical protein
MKKIILIIVTILFTSCSSPLENKFNEETVDKDIKLIKEKLSPEDFEILENTIIRLDFNREELEQMTYSVILENGKNQKSLIKKSQSKIIQLVNFEKEKKLRFKKVIDKLIILRNAELEYHKENGEFTDDKNELARFIETNEKNIFIAPYTDKEFYIEVGIIEKIKGLPVPNFELKIDKESVLKGLNPSLIRDEKQAIGRNEIRGEFISVGSMTDLIRYGNWPSFYENDSY